MNRLSLARVSALIAVALALHAQGAPLDTTADAVLGQAAFTTNATGTSASIFKYATSLATDPVSGRLFVGDLQNNRVLSWPSSSAFTNGQAADLVLGQSNFTQSAAACSATGMSNPAGIAVDLFGNVYVTDQGNHRLLTFRPPLASGMAASGLIGQANFAACQQNRGGTTGSNTLKLPRGAALDANGNLYVADADNNRVLRFAAGAAFLQGTASAEFIYGQTSPTGGSFNQGGAANADTLSGPYCVAVDPAGNLWVCDYFNHRVLRYNVVGGIIDPTADLVLGQPDFVTVTAYASNTASTIYTPTGLAIDAAGAVYVSDTFRIRVLRFTTLSNGGPASAVFGQSGSFTNSNADLTADGLLYPEGLAIDLLGNLLVADGSNSRVLRFDLPLPNGVPTLASLSPKSVPAGTAAFVLTVNGSGFLAGSKVNWNGAPRTTQFISSHRLLAQVPAADVATGGPYAVTVFTPAPGGGTSNFLDFTLDTRAPLDASADRVLGQPDFTSATPGNPQVGEEPFAGATTAAIGNIEGYVVVDPVSGRLFYSETNKHRIVSWPSVTGFTNASSPDLVLGQPNEYTFSCNNGGIGAATLCGPVNIALDAFGALYVPDYGNSRVLQYLPPFTTGMAASRVFGQGGSFTSGTCNNGGGPGANSMCLPVGVAVSDSTLFVGDSANRRILVFNNPYGDFTADAVIGQTNFAGGGNTPVSATSVFGNTHGLSIDRQQRLIASDGGRGRVLRFSPPFTNGMAADLVIGQPDFVSSGGGLAANRLGGGGGGTAIDRGGNLLVVDSSNNRILRFAAPLTNGMAATGVIGQSDFVTGTSGTSRTKFNFPNALALDPVGNLIAVEPGNSRVLAFDRPFATRLPKSDTSGNGKSDFVWRASDGGLSIWNMNGGSVASFSYGVVGTEWQIVATGDFNGDGKADLFWRRNDGATYLWFMDGSRPVGFVDTGVVPLDFVPVAVADFNGDGYADVMFRRTNGQNYMWQMINGVIANQGFFSTLPLEWVVQGTGDLNGDGAADIVWRNTNTNETYVWTMDGSAVLASGQVLPTFDATWQIQGVADFDGDGKDDIQWRRSDGNNYLFAMNGTVVKAYIEQADVGPEWVIQGFGDFNADGRADIVYRHSTSGETVIWLMQVNAPTSTPSVGNPGAIWSIAAPKR